MTTYFDRARARLSPSPPGSLAFWIDVYHLLARRNGGGLDEDEGQRLLDDSGCEWNLVTYRKNPFPARTLASREGERTIIWCLAEPDSTTVDLTPFEDLLGRASSVVDISLDAIAQEIHPELTLPKGLTERLRGLTYDVVAFISELAHLAAREPLTSGGAINALVKVTAKSERGIELSSPSAVLMSTALLLASVDQDILKLVKLTLTLSSESERRLGQLLKVLAESDPRDVVLGAYIGSGLARLGINNIGQLLSAEGWCPPDVRTAYEASSGKWADLGAVLTAKEGSALAERCEQMAGQGHLTRLRDALADAEFEIIAAASEPMPLVRLAALFAHFEDFVESRHSAQSAAAATNFHASELSSIDEAAFALRAAAGVGHVTVTQASRFEDIARDFSRSPLITASLEISRGRLAIRRLEKLMAPTLFQRALGRLEAAEQRVGLALDEWDSVWVSAIRRDLQGFISLERQGWRLSRSYSARGKGSRSWLVVLDGLRYDLWKAIVLPAVEKAGWRLKGDDVSFAYLPSLTEISRKMVIGGAIDAFRSQESALVRATADRCGMLGTYQVRTENMAAAADDAAEWNVRVFSWPDKLVHSDLVDLGSLASQFQAWVEGEFVPWLTNNVSRTDHLVISTDHGFTALDPNAAIEVEHVAEEDRNTPRYLSGNHPELGEAGLFIDHAGRGATIATGQRWFRSPGGRRWKFAHGGVTLFETVVPFAELAAVPEGDPVMEIFDLPAGGIDVDEATELELAFAVKVTGGREMFPVVTVSTNERGNVHRELVPVGVITVVRTRIKATERLSRLIITVTSGQKREVVPVDVRVALRKIRRTELDIDI